MSSVYPEYPRHVQAEESWANMMYPGDKTLWCRLVTGFSIMASVGALFIILGACFFHDARKVQEESGISFGVTLCVIGISCGTLLIGTSVFLARYMISKKWRKIEQPGGYRSRNNHTGHDNTAMQRSSDEVSSTPLPPPYRSRHTSTTVATQASQRPQPCAVFNIYGGQVNVSSTRPLSGNSQPPEYSSEPVYTVNLYGLSYSGLGTGNTGALTPPSYSQDDPCKLPIYGDVFDTQRETQGSVIDTHPETSSTTGHDSGNNSSRQITVTSHENI